MELRGNSANEFACSVIKSNSDTLPSYVQR